MGIKVKINSRPEPEPPCGLLKSEPQCEAQGINVCRTCNSLSEHPRWRETSVSEKHHCLTAILSFSLTKLVP